MHLAGIQTLSLIDFPGNIAAVLFVAGCDFRCPFCQNPDLVKLDLKLPRLSADDVIEVLKDRRPFIDGLAITGGEPLLFPEIVDLIVRVRADLNLAVKIDTNGNHPDTLALLIETAAVDYIAMDLKTSLSRYSEAAGKLLDLQNLKRSIGLLLEGRVPYEFRTTVVPGLVDEPAIDEMGRVIAGAQIWAFQQYQNRVVLDEKYHQVKPLPPERVRALAMRAEPHAKRVLVRGV